LLTEKKKECAEKIKFLEKLNETLKVEEEHGKKPKWMEWLKKKKHKERAN